ncbi:mandelate racemase [Alsobacter sp. SYSU M60028]|uniref:Mandelate racemase n=1 Tax=Alsobacter ponti TaxID=2962936 RepID=A0ABT1LJS3_9HYPH|nr:enolase C-terminal domain-like protein [Alsobacter ponti]MCP8941138.1 mandelate racemase [Alsobacter ponti]
MAGMTGTRPGSRIAKVDIHEFRYTVDGLGVDESGNRCAMKGAVSELKAFALSVETVDGERGEYCSVHSGKSGAMVGQVRALAPHVLGMDAEAREAVYNKLKRLHRHFMAVGHSAIDIALWDLAGKSAGKPVWRMLGGYRTRLPTYASTLNGGRHGVLESKEAYGDFAEQCLARGYRAFKIHGWGEGNAREEADNLLHCAQRVGGRMTLMYDAASELKTFADAVYVGKACDEAGYAWYEDPFMDAGWSPHAARQLKEHVRTPLLLTEHVRGLEPKAPWVTERATDILRTDPDYDMGITGAMKIAHLAEAFGLDCEIHAAGPSQRHCMAAIRNSNWYELSLVAPGVRNPVPPVFGSGYSDDLEAIGEDGCFPVPDGPGLGVEYDWDFITRNRTALDTFSMPR